MPRGRDIAPKFNPRPLIGFGRIGIVATAIALSLVLVMVTGFDLRYKILQLAAWWLGADAALELLAWFGLYWISLFSFQFGLIGMMYAVVAVHIHPRRISRLLYMTLFAWGITEPLIFGKALAAGWRIIRATSTPNSFMEWYWFSYIAATCCTLALLLLVTRSWWIICLVAGIAVFVNLDMEFDFSPLSPMGLVYTWHAAIATGLFSWAIVARIRYAKTTQDCPACAYDRTGLPHEAPCPECGAAPPPSTTT